MRGRWHIVNAHRNQIAFGSTASRCTSPKLMLQARKLTKALHKEVACAHQRETGAIDLGAPFSSRPQALTSVERLQQRHQACRHRRLGVSPFQGRSFQNLVLWTHDHGLHNHAARFCKFAKTPRTPPPQGVRHLDDPSPPSGAETFVSHFTLGPSKTFAALLISRWSSSDTLKLFDRPSGSFGWSGLWNWRRLSGTFSLSKMLASSDTCKFRSCHIKPSGESTFSSSPHVEILTAVLCTIV